MAAYGDVLDAAVGHLVNIYIYGGNQGYGATVAHCIHITKKKSHNYEKISHSYEIFMS